MLSNHQRISTLLLRHVQGSLTPQEQAELEEFLTGSPATRRLFDSLQDEKVFAQKLTHFAEIKKRSAEAATSPVTPIRTAHRIHFLKTAWVRYAAAIIIVFGIGAYLWNIQQKDKPLITETKPVPAKNDVAPGSNRAILTLADGSTIVLDSAANGELARQVGASIFKNSDGHIVYNAAGKVTNVVYNTMATPRGGQYQLKLPDGTMVWLNAASSITYPTSFIDNEREVKVTGELYLEVAKDPKKPFIVTIEGKPSIEVLGTHFNVNAYPDERIVATTLLEGSVRTGSIILRPGQQAKVAADNSIVVDEKADIDKVMAWRNGKLNFEDLNVDQVMRLISRWYDIEVVYQNKPPDIHFFGTVSRNASLSTVLKVLEKSDVRFTIQGKKLVVQ